MSKFLERMDKEIMLAPMTTGDAIDSMHNDPVVTDCLDMLQSWRNTWMATRNTNSSRLINDDAFKGLVISMERILYNRFGMHIKLAITSTHKSVACARIVTPLNDNVIQSTTAQVIDKIKKHKITPRTERMLDSRYREGDVRKAGAPEVGVTFTKGEPVDTSHMRSELITVHNNADMLYLYKHSVDELEKALKFKGVKIDTKQGKFINLSRDIIGVIYFDYVELVEHFQFTDREVLAILFHEIGHLYTGIAYSYKTYRTNLIMADSIIESVESKGYSPKKALTIAYRKATGEDLPRDLQNAKDEVAYIETLDLTYRYQNRAFASIVSFTNKEAVADQFTTRFGLGAEAATAINKAYKKERNLGILYLIPGVLFFSMSAWCAIAATSSLGMIFFASLTAYWTMYVLRKLYDLFSPDRDDDIAATHDYIDRRVIRIRNDMVRQLRTSDFTKEEIDKIIRDYDMVTGVIKELPKPTESIFGKISAILFSTKNYKKRTTEMEYLIENLTENDLHIEAARFKNLK